MYAFHLPISSPPHTPKKKKKERKQRKLFITACIPKPQSQRESVVKTGRTSLGVNATGKPQVSWWYIINYVMRLRRGFEVDPGVKIQLCPLEVCKTHWALFSYLWNGNEILILPVDIRIRNNTGKCTVYNKSLIKGNSNFGVSDACWEMWDKAMLKILKTSLPSSQACLNLAPISGLHIQQDIDSVRWHLLSECLFKFQSVKYLLYFDLYESSKIKDGFWMLVVKWTNNCGNIKAKQFVLP